MRRRLAVTAVVLAALVGEWVGHSLAYYRFAGLAGLQAAVTSGVHDYMLPLGLALLVVAATGATLWTHVWLALGQRLDRSGALLCRLRRGDRLHRAPAAGSGASAAAPTPSLPASVAALTVPMALIQCALYVVQENLERTAHGLPAPGVSPLLAGLGAAAWIQSAVAAALATAVVVAGRLLQSRLAAVQRIERLVRALWERAQRPTSSPRPKAALIVPAQLLLGSAIWQRPPPAPIAA
jgi:hypothetical protein